MRATSLPLHQPARPSRRPAFPRMLSSKSTSSLLSDRLSVHKTKTAIALFTPWPPPFSNSFGAFPRTTAGRHSPTLPTPQSMWRSPSLLPPRSGIGCARPSVAIHLFRSVPVRLLLLRVLAPLPFLDLGTRGKPC